MVRLKVCAALATAAVLLAGPAAFRREARCRDLGKAPGGKEEVVDRRQRQGADDRPGDVELRNKLRLKVQALAQEIANRRLRAARRGETDPEVKKLRLRLNEAYRELSREDERLLRDYARQRAAGLLRSP